MLDYSYKNLKRTLYNVFKPRRQNNINNNQHFFEKKTKNLKFLNNLSIISKMNSILKYT